MRKLRTYLFLTYQEVNMAKVIKRLPSIPAERTLAVIAGRWKASILYYLFDGPKRLSDLKRLAPRASQKVLIEQLRELEEHGVVHREVFAKVPSRVDYTVTELGLTLQPLISTLCDWGRRHASALDELNLVDNCMSKERPQDGAASSQEVQRREPVGLRDARGP
jgi:DNA-binding HxlR family transcriptional regulator